MLDDARFQRTLPNFDAELADLSTQKYRKCGRIYVPSSIWVTYDPAYDSLAELPSIFPAFQAKELQGSSASFKSSIPGERVDFFAPRPFPPVCSAREYNLYLTQFLCHIKKIAL